MHRDEGIAVGLVYLVDRANVGVRQSCRRFRLALEALANFSIAKQVIGEEFQSYLAVEFGVKSAINDAHAAFT